MSTKTAISAMLLLSAAAIPALAEDYVHDPARADRPTVLQAPLFGSVVAAQPGTARSAATQPVRKEARSSAQAPTLTDATTGSSAAVVGRDPFYGQHVIMDIWGHVVPAPGEDTSHGGSTTESLGVSPPGAFDGGA